MRCHIKLMCNNYLCQKGDDWSCVIVASKPEHEFRVFRWLAEVRGISIFDQVIDRVRTSTCGAVVSFVGTVRDNSEGKRVLYLEYDVYAEMAKKKLSEIATEIQARWGLGDVAIVHRVGRLEIGEAAIVIAVGSAHGLEAFQACQYAIDRIKEIVPIWKKEFYEGSATWIGHK